MSHENYLKRFRRVFCGKQTKSLYNSIEEIKNTKIQEILYEICYRCQELESNINALESRVADLEKDG